jgi:hypothetical protein
MRYSDVILTNFDKILIVNKIILIFDLSNRVGTSIREPRSHQSFT